MYYGGKMDWQVLQSTYDEYEEEDGVSIKFSFSTEIRRKAFNILKSSLRESQIPWLNCIEPRNDRWRVDLDILKEYFNDVKIEYDWFCGKHILTPEFDVYERESFGNTERRGRIAFHLTKSELEDRNDMTHQPNELKDYLKAFRRDYPNSNRCIFLMMKFGNTLVHQEIVELIRATCKRHGYSALRADDKRYSALPGLVWAISS